MPLSNSELVMGGFSQLPDAVQKTSDYNRQYGPTSDAYKDLYTKLMTGEIDIDTAKREVIKRKQGEQTGGAGLSGTAPNGAPPLDTSVPVREPGGAVAPVEIPPIPVAPNATGQRRPLVKSNAPAPTPQVQEPSADPLIAAMDGAAQPLAQRNPALAAAPTPQPQPQAPQRPSFPIPQTRDEAAEVAPLLGHVVSQRNARTAAQSRQDVAALNAASRASLAEFNAQKRSELEQTKGSIRAALQDTRLDAHTQDQLQLFNHQADMLQAKLDAQLSMARDENEVKMAISSYANDVKVLGIMVDQYLGTGRNMATMAAAGAGFVGGQGRPVFNQMQTDADKARPQVEQGLQNMSQRYGVVPPLPGQSAQAAPQPSGGASTSTTTTTTQPVQPPRVLVPGSTAARQAAAAPPPAPAPAPAPQQNDAAANAAIDAASKPPSVSAPKPQKRKVLKASGKKTEGESKMPKWAVGKSPGGKPYAKKQYSPSRNATRFLDDKGNPVEVVNGRK